MELTPEEYRRIALSLPEAVESSHMKHPDFRVRGKIFATLYKGNGVVMLSREQQDALTKSNPEVFAPAVGGWGRRGSTTVHLEVADDRLVREALSKAWRNKAPKDLL